MALLDDFKTFAFKGNVVDLAVGVVIGGAFGKIVTAAVADVIMPVVALVLPSGDWRNHGVVLHHAADPKDDAVLKYGDFLGSIVDFVVVAFFLFLIVSKIIQGAERHISKKEPASKECPFCLETVPFKATRCKACTSQFA